MNQMKVELPTPDNFSFEQIRAYLARSANECLFDVHDGTVTRCIPAANEKPIVTIGSETAGRLWVDIAGVDPSRLASVRDPVLQYVAEWFDLNREMAPFYRLADRDPLLAGPVSAFRGLRVVGVPDLFEAASWAILGQQINLSFAYTLKRRLVEAFGESAAGANGERYWLFPSAERIAAAAPSDLTGLQMTGKKAEYLIGVAEMVADGSLAKERLLDMENAAAAERTLTLIRGIGPWTAHYVAMRCLRFPDAFPVGDVGLHLAIQKALGLERKPSLAEIRTYASAWSGWEAYATFFLWRTLY